MNLVSVHVYACVQNPYVFSFKKAKDIFNTCSQGIIGGEKTHAEKVLHFLWKFLFDFDHMLVHAAEIQFLNIYIYRFIIFFRGESICMSLCNESCISS